MTSTGTSSEPEGAHGPEDRSAHWIEDHADAVFRYVRRRLPVEDAEDVTQQAFEALFRAQAEGRVPDNPAAYLLGTARRRVADRMRTRARRGPTVTLPDGWEGFASQPLPPEALANQELRGLVQIALGLLSGPDRMALLAFHREQASVAEVGARLGASTKAAEMRLRRARQAFAAFFAEIGRDWLDTVASDTPVQPEAQR